MNFLDQRRSKLSPTAIKAIREDLRQRTALAVSIAGKKARAEVQTEILEALAVVKAKAANA
ncbi:hypothetical protein [Mesorhizobium sp. LNJC405B00]|uniref:hypothetical protein n=1 Tax=Mesorhizobium sp. LNJC405B00 TaxID=1287281 RepID=UPI0003CE9F51|nr:hypothetical protein [Mesorhizobium sp. LNJC405B00]ESY02755.1 hypothetical protein X755_01210 [Mesorhizobium sp. LNJC405B00]